MVVRVAINGFGRIGRILFRILWEYQREVQIVMINDPRGGSESAAHLLQFDSVYGKWNHNVSSDGANAIMVNNTSILFTETSQPADLRVAENNVDIILECSGKFVRTELLSPFLEKGAKKVIVSAPVEGALNIVYGINDFLYDKETNHIITAASCTTNCIAPIIKVLHEKFGILRGLITTIHDVTNTQTVCDQPHKDLRRARSCLMSLVPTTSGSAKAIGKIFPDLNGKLNTMAIRVPLLNASLVDCVFEVAVPTNKDEVNQVLRLGSEAMPVILGFEQKPLVSIDFKGDSRSAIVDALSTMVNCQTQVKIIAWYDNEYGYTRRMADLVLKVASLI